MNRFGNPHVGFPQHRQPMQQQPHMQQPQQQQFTPIPLDNGFVAVYPNMVYPNTQMYQLNNGLVAVDPRAVLPQFMPNQGGYAPNVGFQQPQPYQQQPMMQPMTQPQQYGGIHPGNRFNANAQPPGIMSDRFSQPPVANPRFQQPEQPTAFLQPMQVERQATNKENKTMVIQVNLDTSETIKFNNSNLSFETNKIKYSIKSVENLTNISVVCCMGEAVDQLLGDIYPNIKPKKIYRQSVIITDRIFGTSNNLINKLKDKEQSVQDILKAAYNEATNKNDLTAAMMLDEQFTEIVNDFLEVNSPESLSIDSYMSDYDELVAVMSNQTNLLDAYNKMIVILENMRDGYIDAINIVEETSDPEDVVQSAILCSSVNMYYVDAMDVEFNLDKIEYESVEIPMNMTNGLSSVISSICSSDYDKFKKNYLVTYNKSIFEIFEDTDSKRYLRKV